MKRLIIVLFLLIATELFSEGARYLIITADQYYDAVLPLSEWKYTKGLMPKIAKLSEIGDQAINIKTYIRNAYNNWSPRPEYILLVGDKNAIPYGIYFPNWTLYYPEGLGTWTDQYYVNLTEGTDYQDDIIIGRFPCANATQCSVMVNKTLSYEQATGVKQTNWFAKATLCARDNEDNVNFNSYYRTTCRKIQNVLTSAGFAKIDTFFASDSADRDSVEHAVNNGRGYLTYRGSTSSTSDNWRTPFVIRNDSIANESMPSVVLGTTCRNMFFPEQLPTFPEPLTAAGNSWMRKGDVNIPEGAVAFFGTTTHFCAGFDSGQVYWRNAAAVKFFEVITNETTYVLGKAIKKVKDSTFTCCSLYTLGKTNRATACSVAYMEWNLLGDPELNLRTSIPKLLSVTYDTVISIGSQILTITVKCEGVRIKNALVCIIMDSTIYQYGYTDGNGNVNFSVNPLYPGQISMTVSARNGIPFRSNIRVSRGHDVGVTSIIEPVGITDSILSLTPKAIVKNFGISTESFITRLSISTNNWSSSKLVSNLVPGEERQIGFDTWQVPVRGNYQVKCSTELAADMLTANNKIEDSFIIAVRDYAVTSITAPVNIIDSASFVTPKVWIHNFGNVIEISVPVIMNISSTAYCDTQLVTLNAGDSALRSFDRLLANIPRGNYVVCCTSKLNHDYNMANNFAAGLFSIRVRDFAVGRISQPASPIDSGSAIIPKAWVHNYGTTDITNGAVILSIDNTQYSSSKIVSLGAGDSIEIIFDTFALNIPRANYTMRCLTSSSGDMVLTNNLSTKLIRIQVSDAGVTQIVSPTGLINITSLVAPRVKIKNFGTEDNETCSVTLKIGSIYTGTRSKILASGQEDTVNFPVWTPVLGTYSVRCSVYLAHDIQKINDTLTGSVTVYNKDVGVTQIVTPIGIVDSGVFVFPQARITNFGVNAETFTAFFKVGTIYSQSRQKTLLAGQTDTINFPVWTAVERGQYQSACSTALTGDMYPSNDKITDSVVVRVRDIGVVQIVSPVDTVDTINPINPIVRLKNYGSLTETFNVILKIGNIYNNMRAKTLGAGIEDTVNFISTIMPRGLYQTRCSTALAGDVRKINDTLSASVFMRVKDVGLMQIVSPPDSVDSGTVITPMVRGQNYGNTLITIPVSIKIGSFYSEQRNKTLLAGQTDTINFPGWIAGLRGLYVTKCSFALSGDINSTNNKLLDTTIVRVRDVGVTQIIAPIDSIDSTAIIYPRAKVKNFGSINATFNAAFKIGNYLSIRTKTLASGIEDTINFSQWIPVRGNFQARCSTYFNGDLVRSNDTMSAAVQVRVSDVGIVGIISPSTVADSGVSITPKVLVKNYGNRNEVFPITLFIGNDFYQTKTETLSFGLTDTIEFDAWNPIQTASNAISCSTQLIEDMNPTNNIVNDSVFVRTADAGVFSIITPAGSYYYGDVVIPKAEIKNFGNRSETFLAIFKLGSYLSSKTITVGAGTKIPVYFDTCRLRMSGSIIGKCSTALAGDIRPINNSLPCSIFVRCRDVGVSQIITPYGTIDSTGPISPVIQVRNNGTDSSTFFVTLRLDSTTHNIYNYLRVKYLEPNTQDTVIFPSLNLGRGIYTARCSTYLADDSIRSNDTLSGSFTVRVRDVGVIQILTLPDIIDSGQTITPVVQVRNFGSALETLQVTLKIGNTYNSARNKILSSEQIDTVKFSNWTAIERGWRIVKCSTAISGDINPTNNVLIDSVFIRRKEIRLTQIVSPPDTVDSGTVVTPILRVGNFGNTNETLFVTLKIGSNYTSTRNKVLLTGQIDTINFTNFLPAIRGNITLRCTSAFFYSTRTVFVRVRDWGVTRIILPSGIIDTSMTIIPQVKVKNYGNVNYPVYAWFKIYRDDDTTNIFNDSQKNSTTNITKDQDSSFRVFNISCFRGNLFRTLVYSDSINFTIQQLDSITATFRSWHPTTNGNYSLLSFVAPDMQPRNDSATGSVNVSSIQEEQNLGVLPKEFKLGNNYPNPFFFQTIINYALPKDCHINLKIYNSSGRIIRILKDKNEKAGFYRINWDSRDERGEIVPAGIYFYHLATNEYTATRKMLMLK